MTSPERGAMRGLWLEAGRLSYREDLPVPVPPSGECLVRVTTAGICNTDLELLRGYYPYTGIPGHEFVGVVEQGPAKLVGRRVVGEINAVCGDCESCRAGRPTHCLVRSVLGIVKRHGAFADFLVLPARNLHVLPEHLSDDAAVFTEPLAAALEVLEQLPLGPDERVLVVGDGKLGQLIARVLARTGSTLAVVGRQPAKLQLLEDAGIRTLHAHELADGAWDVAVECTGNPEGFALAQRCLRPRGTLVLKSTYAGRLSLDAAALVVDEITLIGSRCGPFAPALELLSAGGINPAPLIHDRFCLSDGHSAFERAGEPGILKVLLEVAR